jgi:hypothetical protein
VRTKRLHEKPEPAAGRGSRSNARTDVSPTYLVQFGLFDLSPGSPQAQMLGCSCREHDGSEMFVCECECSIHGLDVLISALDETSTDQLEFERG